MSDKLTPRERETLDYIVTFKKVNGFAPTLREIAHGINTHSITHISQMLNSLSDKGYITFKEKSPRTIRVIKFD